MTYDPNPLLIGEVRQYFQRLHSQLETVHNATGQGPGTWESYLTTRGTGSATSPDLNHVARYGSLYLSASRWTWPGMLATYRDTLESRWRAAADYLARVQQLDGRWERSEGGVSSLEDAFATSDAVEFLGRAYHQDLTQKVWEGALTRGQAWLREGVLSETGPSAGHPGPPLDAAIFIQNPNFVASIVRALDIHHARGSAESIQKGVWYLLQAQNMWGTWWWYGTDDTGRSTFSMTYHELVVAGMTPAWLDLPSPLREHTEEALELALDYMIGQQASSGPVLPGSLRQYQDQPGISPMGVMGLAFMRSVLERDPSVSVFGYTVLRALMANYHPTAPTNPLLVFPQAWAQARGAIARSLAVWMDVYRG